MRIQKTRRKPGQLGRSRDIAQGASLAPVALSHPPDLLVSRLLYRDALVLIIDKPAGLAVHAGPGGGETLEHYLEALRFGLPVRPELGHRLDRDTSGCLVLGRHKQALRRLGRLFQAGEVEKTYMAIVTGAPPQASGRIAAPLSKRSTAKRGWWMKVDDAGQPAVTDYRLCAQADGHSLLELHPRTGRTHQLRVHLAHLGCPILGDGVYGGESAERMMLHARALRLPLYAAKPLIEAKAPWPPALREAAERMGLALPTD